MIRTVSGVSAAALMAACLVSSVAHAADEGAAKKDAPADAPAEGADKAATKDEEKPDAPEKKDDAATKPASDEAAQADATADAAQGNSAAELPGKTYRFVGFRYRGIVVPKFMQNLFADGGTTLYVHGFGPEFAIRKDGFEYNLSAWLALYNMGDTAFKGSSDGNDAWEIISAKMQILYLTSDFMWSHEFSPEFALNYGLGAGFGIVFGDLNRTQAYPRAGGDPGNPDSFAKCDGQLSPDLTFCGTDNNHYSGYKEKSWAGGGSKPLLFPWLALQTGLRFKVARQFAARLDLGFGTSGFFFGVGGDYGL